MKPHLSESIFILPSILIHSLYEYLLGNHFPPEVWGAIIVLFAVLLLRSQRPFCFLSLGDDLFGFLVCLNSGSLQNLSFGPCVLKYHSDVPWWGSIFIYSGGSLKGWRAHWTFYWSILWILSSPPSSLCSLSRTSHKQILAFLDPSSNFCFIFLFYFNPFPSQPHQGIYSSLSSSFSIEFLIADIIFNFS